MITIKGINHKWIKPNLSEAGFLVSEDIFLEFETLEKANSYLNCLTEKAKKEFKIINGE